MISSSRFNMVLLTAAIALLAAACGSPGDARGDGVVDTTTTTTAATTTTISADDGTYDGIPVGFTDDGFPYLGDPEAPVTINEYSDYLCPFCGRYFSETAPQLIDDYVRSGEARIVFHDFPLVDLHPNAPSGHAAARCVAEQGAPLFWAMHDALFSDQEAWAGLADTSGYLAGLATSVGADPAIYEDCIAAGATIEAVNSSVAATQQLGFTGTPSFVMIDNRSGTTYPVVGAQPTETFVLALDTLVAGEDPNQGGDQQAQLPFWATPEGLAPDPDRPGYTLAGDAYHGDPDAAIKVIEFSDFQCPYCGRHALETQPALDEEYVDTGEVQWVFKHLPLAIHPQAQTAAVAAECAGEQEAFWPMHDLLFSSVDEWAVDPPDPVLVDLADRLGLDTAAFETCLGSRAPLERVLSDANDAQIGISSTPSFVVIVGDQAGVIEGARPLADFQSAFDSLLAEG